MTSTAGRTPAGTSAPDKHAGNAEWLALAQRLGDGCGRTTAGVLDEIVAAGVGDLVTVVVPEVGEDPAGPDASGVVRIVAASGDGAAEWRGRRGSADGLRVAAVLRDGRSRLVADASERLDSNVRPLLRVRSAVFAALTDATGRTWGVLTVGRHPSSARFTEADVAVATMLARLVPEPAAETPTATASEVGDPGRPDAAALARVAERDRIARALSAAAIGRLFTLGMRLQGAAGTAPAPLRRLLADSSDEIDDVAKAIRRGVYALDR